MKPLLLFITLAALFAATSGCNKKDISDLPVSALDKQLSTSGGSDALNDFFNADSDGHIYIAANMESFTDYDGTALTYTVMGSIMDIDNLESNLPFGDLTVGENTFSADASYNEYSAQFTGGYVGQDVTISLLDASNTDTEFSQVLYFPLPFDYSDISVPTTLGVGSTITWNADAGNEKGLLIALRYNLGDLQDAASYENFNERYIYVGDDDGSYTLNSDDAAGFNTSSTGDNNCMVSLIRGDYAMAYNASNSSLNTKVIYTIASQWFVVQTD